MIYKLSPSDFAFLYQECKRCYYLKVKDILKRPSMLMPGVFSAINTRLQTPLVGKNLRELSADLPDGEVVQQEGWVESEIIPETQLFIKGKYDLLVKNSDDTYTLVDLKISQPDIGKIEKYQTQLNAYRYALEHPKTGQAYSISSMALLVFYPDTVNFEDGKVLINFPPKWLEVPMDEFEFLSFSREINALLTGPLPPESDVCEWCHYRKSGSSITSQLPTQPDLPF